MIVARPYARVMKNLLDIVILASAFMKTTLAEDGAGGLRQQSFSVLSNSDGCKMSHLMTAPMRSRIECATTCLSKHCSLYQYNTTAQQCHIYSDQPGGEGLQDESEIFATEGYSGNTNDPWFVFVRRQDGSVDFQRNWTEYRVGFGDPCGEFWLGLENLHTLTANQPYKLRAEMTDFDGNEYFAEYSTFQVGAETTYYTLSVSGYDNNSTAGDSMAYHNNQNFTTVGVDNDWMPLYNCADMYTGAWWYGMCHLVHPTGTYFPQVTMDANGLTWQSVSGLNDWYSFKTMRLMIKP